MGGGATIGPSIVNIGAGANGKYKISTIVAGLCMLLYVLVAEPVVALVPTSALVGVMCIVVYQTFEWSAIPIVLTTLLPQSVREHKWLDSARKIKRSDAIVIILVTVLTLVTDLMIATLAGVLLSAAVYAWQTGQQVDVVHSYVWERRPDTADAADEADSTVEETTGVVDTASDTSSAATEDGAGEGEGDVVPADAPPCPGPNFRLVKQYHLTGPLFFASAPALSKLFTPKADPSVVELHMHAYSKVQVHDFSGMDMLNSVGEKYAKAGKVFRVMRLNAAASKMVSKADKLAEHFSYHEEAVPLQDSADFEA
ncbi:ybaR, partial [Symbiodinium sp. KB8]